MKNKLSSLLLVGIVLLTGSLSGVAVFLDNNYGAKLNFKISPLQPEGQYVGHNVRVGLGDINSIPELSIRTTGIGSSYLSPYHSLNYFLTDIKNQQARHSNDDAIIVIGASPSYSSSWNIYLMWEPKGKNIKPFEYADIPTLVGVPKTQPKSPSQPLTQPAVMMNIDQLEKELALMESSTADGRLAHIKDGALGSDYASKATEICNAHYTKAEKLGKINLCSRLKTELLAPQYQPQMKRIKAQIAEAKRRKQKTVVVAPDLAPAIEDIKNSINRIHNALAGYKSRGEAQ
jgi:hypothetical protein